MPLTFKQTIAPTFEPISLDQVKAHLRVSVTDEDDYLGELMAAAREKCEADTNRQFMPATFRLSLDYFPCRLRRFGYDGGERAWEHGRYFRGESILLPRPMLQGVTSIQYLDTSGATQTLSGTQYVVDSDSEPGRVALAPNCYWPDTSCQINAVTITYTAGYSLASATVDDQQSAVPPSVKHMIRLLVGHWYENRESTTDVPLKDTPQAYRSLLDTIRVPWVF